MATNPININELDLHTFKQKDANLPFQERIQPFYAFIQNLKKNHWHSYQRMLLSPSKREVTIYDPSIPGTRKMLMFGANNYLGLANDPYVVLKMKKAAEKYGAGVGGPPLLNGYTYLMNELEERLASLKHQESAMVFPTGYSANLGLLSAVLHEHDCVIFDAFSHASFFDGLHFSHATHQTFPHNDLQYLEALLQEQSNAGTTNIFVGIEGVYSMDGDLAPLDKMIPLIKKYNAFSLLDDAHGTGVLGQTGSGTAEHFGVSTAIDISMGTFSKAFAVTGGFLAGSKEIINYIKYYARPYMFSAALPPVALAAVLAGLDIIENEPWRREQLLENAQYAQNLLQAFGLFTKSEAAIIALSVPDWMDIRKANRQFHEAGIFLNAVEYPAVPLQQQRFRVSIMTQHTKHDIDRLVEVVHQVWNNEDNRKDYR